MQNTGALSSIQNPGFCVVKEFWEALSHKEEHPPYRSV